MQIFACLFGFYGISTFVGYLMPNPFLYKESVLFQTIQFSQTVLIQIIRFSINIVYVYTQLNFKTVLFQAIQFIIQKQLHFKQFSLA